MILNVHFTLRVHFKRLSNIIYHILNFFGANILIEKPDPVENPKFCYLPTRLIDGTTSWLEKVDRETIIDQSKWVKFATQDQKPNTELAQVDQRDIPVGDLILKDTPSHHEAVDWDQLLDDVSK